MEGGRRKTKEIGWKLPKEQAGMSHNPEQIGTLDSSRVACVIVALRMRSVSKEIHAERVCRCHRFTIKPSLTNATGVHIPIPRIAVLPYLCCASL